METNQNRSSQPQGRTNQTSQSNSNPSQQGSSSSSQYSQSSNPSQSSSTSSNANQKSSSATSLGGMNMGSLTQQFQKYSGPIMNKLNSLSTTQKIVGGSLLAAGAGWLAMNSKNKKKGTTNMNRTPKNRY